MLRIHSLFFLLLLCVGRPLSAAEKQPLPLSEAILPRSMHAYWIYENYEWAEDHWKSLGQLREDVVAQRNIEGQTCWLIRQQTDHRSFWQKVAEKPLEEKDITLYWETLDEKGSHNEIAWNHLNPAPPQKLSDFELNLPYPVEKGTRYHAQELDWTVREVDEEIDVPAGTFSCVVYEAILNMPEVNAAYRSRIYLSVGTGVIRMQTSLQENGKWTLISRDDLRKVSIPQISPDS
ncbi:hypothetical protein P3T73_05905 [Kiritimatiellota bacterium B12222]|nr:hypothetical protein P3T73_05905 [Kiritimatiellota bacterium B12222]